MSDKDDCFKWMCELISEYSEESYCAGWLDGVEFTILEWRDQCEAGTYDPVGKFGISYKMLPSKLKALVEMSSKHDMWPVWADKPFGQGGEVGESGPAPKRLQEARDAAKSWRDRWARSIAEGKCGPDSDGLVCYD